MLPTGIPLGGEHALPLQEMVTPFLLLGSGGAVIRYPLNRGFSLRGPFDMFYQLIYLVCNRMFERI